MGADSTKDALNRYYAKEAKASLRRPRKNEKPEFEFKKVAVKWLAENGFECDVVESKAVYNFAAGRYDHGQTEAGFSDIVGVTPYYGVACYIELKAPGKRSTLKVHQRDFLLVKIRKGAFGICADSVEYIAQIYQRWQSARAKHLYAVAQQILVDALPKVKELTDNLDDIVGELKR